jgi:hypothetical protein
MMILAGLTANAKKDWKGKVVDEKGEPVAYANVAVLSPTDSSVVCGAVTEEDGTFNIVTKENEGIMMVAMLGYQTRYFTPIDGMVITLIEDSDLLQGAIAMAVMPKTKLTGEGLQTNVRGSVLENVGNAQDVLAKTPGIIKGQNGIEVIGKGAPLVYINGHKVSDATELNRLQSNEIQSIEVITNPGAQYDATVRSVVRIKTIRRQGDGFGFNVNATDSQSPRWLSHNDPEAAFNANYRTGGVDLFAGFNYTRNSSRQESDILKRSYGKNYQIENDGTLMNEYFLQWINGNAGVNWQIADNHFLGGKVEWGKTLSFDLDMMVTDKVSENGTLVDQLTTASRDQMGVQPVYNLGANLYYNGVIGEKLGVDVNLDYYGNDDSRVTFTEEASSVTSDAEISSSSFNAGRMYAGKAVLSYPIWTGQLQVGTEETFSRRKDEYTIAGVSIPSSSAQIIEDNYAAFASYGFMLPKVGMLNAGVRYEYVHYAYEDAKNPSDNLSRNYGNWFPTVSYSNAFGPVQIMLNYSAKTTRPNYANLSGAIRYNSRYILQSGNAQLQPELSHTFGATAIWKFVTLMVNYTRTDNAIMTWSSPYGDDGVVLVKPRNIEVPYRNLTAFVNLTPTIGPWTMNYTLGLQPQWLTVDVEDPREATGTRTVNYSGKPIWFAQLNNTVTLQGGWQLELGGLVQSTGYSGTLYITDAYTMVNAAVQKTLLSDGSLVLRLEGNDILGTARMNVDTDFGSHTIRQTNLMDQQRIKLSIRYNFNTAQSKYRGTGAGADSKSRM